MKLSFKENKWLYAFILACVLLVAAVTATIILATQMGPKEPKQDAYVEGAEVGIYYYDMVNGEVLLTLSGGNVFTLAGPEVNKTGTYTLNNGSMVLDFIRDEDGTTTATMTEDEIALNYLDATMTFRKKISYKVDFSADGQVQTQMIINGKSALQPADPVKEGHVFLGWYADAALTVPYAFGNDLITADTTLYAKFVPTVVGRNEYTVDFDLGFEGAQAPEAVKTVGGMIYTMPDEPVREGYTFAGWWISMDENGEKLSYRYQDTLVFAADTTLFALWIDNADSKLSAPLVSMDASGAAWDAVQGATGYQIILTDAAGTVVAQEELGATTYSVDFENMPAGVYKLEVVAVASSAANNSAAAVRYFHNKALDRVSQFQVIDGVLAFNAVAHAQKYYITIVCGDPTHNHTMFDNGNSTIFHFANCAMQPGGIRIQVTASANGYADSVSEVFVYDRTLAAVEDVVYNQEEDAFVWNKVENATGYIVTVTVGENTQQFNIGNKTFFSAAAYTGNIAVAVTPVTEGYNSPEAATASFDKIAPATPSGLTVSNMILSWDAAMGATSYEVKIGAQVFSSNTNSLDLAAIDMKFVAGTFYDISVKSFSGNESSNYCQSVSMGYQAMNMDLTYYGNTVYWTPAIGVQNYEVRVNGIVVASVTNANCAKVILTQSGMNKIEVRFADNGGSQWASVEVKAFKITYNSRSLGGEVVEYLAVGDTLSLPQHFTNNGYDFAGWYNSPAASEGNGKKIEKNVFTGNADTVYYADWTPKEYKITPQVDGFELTNIEQGDFFTVTYTQHFTLEVPKSSNPVYTSFVGWFDGPSGSGTMLTDATGKSVAPFSTYHDVIAYPFFDTNILSFEKDSDGTMEVTAGPNIDNVTTLTIPYTYGGVEVTTILEGAFNNCNNLEIVNIPNTIELVGFGAFSGAANLKQINVYSVEGNHDVYYSSHDGVLIRHDMGAVYIDTVPRAKTGTYEIPDYVTALGTRTFQLSALSKVVVSSSVNVVYTRAFYRCENLEAVEFKGGRTTPLTLQSELFYSCPDISYLYLPANINEFDLHTLDRLKNLATIEVEAGGTVYGSVDGMVTNGLQDTLLYAPSKISGAFTVPRGIQNIGSNALQNRTGITSVVIPNYVKTIGSHAFANTSKIKTVVFSGDRKNDLLIDNSAFHNCTTLDSIIFEGSTDGQLETGVITIGNSAFTTSEGKSDRLRTVEFRDGVNIAKIGQSAFSNQKGLYNLSFGNNIRVEEIGDNAFSGCSLLPSIVIPASTVRIGKNAFANCTNVSSVTFAEGGNEIAFGDGAFSGCGKIVQINLPATLVNFNGSVFKGCDMISQINVAPESTFLTSENGVLYSKDYSQLLYYPKALPADWDTLSKLRWDTISIVGDSVFEGNEKVTTFVIMKNVTQIAANAFQNCKNLTSVTCETKTAVEGGADKLVINQNAFVGCSSLAQVSIPDYTTSIGNLAFQGACFAAFEMPEHIVSIGSSAFSSNKKLQAIHIPAKVTSVGNGAFSGCTELQTVTFAEGGSLLTLGNASGGNGVFYNCKKLVAIDFKNRVTEIGNYAFYNTGICNDSTMTGIVLESNVKVIGDHAFYQARYLTFITIPKSVTSIGDKAFLDSGLKVIEFESGGTESLSFGSEVFENTYLQEITIPSRTTVLYRNRVVATRIEPVCDISMLFENVRTLKNIHVESGSAKFLSIEGVLYEIDENGEPIKMLLCPVMNEGRVVDGKPSGEIIIPNTVTHVVHAAMRDVCRIHTVTFQEFDKEDERYGTQRLVMGFENSSLSCVERLTVIGGVDTNSIQTINIPSHMYIFGPYCIGKTQNKVTMNVNPDATEIVLGYYAFNASRITEFVFTGVKRCERMCFNGCGDATRVVFGPESTVSTIMINTFSGTQITSMELPASVETLDNQAFFGCKTLESVSFAEGSKLTSIGTSAFYGCESLVDFDLSNVTKLKNIGITAFSHTPLKSFTFPESLQSLGASLFWDCKELEEITLSSTFTAAMLYSGNDSIFDNAPALRAIYVEEGNMELCSVDGVLYDRTMSIVYRYPVARPVNGYQIPETVRVIEKGAFKQFSGSELKLPDNLEKINASAFQEACIHHYVIPASVTTIGARGLYSSFSGDYPLSITFEPGSKLTSIGSDAFRYCKNVKSINIPDSVRVIGNGAFGGCESLESFILPAALVKLEADTFRGCTNLKEIVLQQGLTEIGKGAFASTKISELNIPASVRVIAEEACLELEKLISVNFAEGSVLDSVGASAFEGCTMLYTINLPDRVKSVGVNAFMGNGNLVYFNIPQSLTEIPEGMLDGCKNLKAINIPTSVTSIGARAFANNSSIADIQIPAAVSSIGTAAFEGCESAASIVFASGSAVRELGTDVEGQDNIFKGTVSAKTLVLPSNLTFIGGHVFENCGVSTLNIPTTVTEIGQYAFADCDNVRKVTISGNVLYLGDYAFFDCDDLRIANLSTGIEYLGTLVFGFCEKLTSAYIPATVIRIGSNPFAGCTAAGDVVVDPANKHFVVEDGVLYDLSKTILYAYPTDKTAETFVIPDTITEIPAGAFACTQLKSIEFPSRLKAIEPYTFAGCELLTDVKIPSGIQSIGDGAFRGCTALVNVDIPSSAYLLGNYVFADCTSLKNVEFLGSGTYYLGTHFFENCKSMTELMLPQNFCLSEEEARKYGLMNNNGSFLSGAKAALPSYMFAGAGLVNVEIPANVKWLGTDGVFMNCKDLRTLRFKSTNVSCKYVGNYYFYGCSSLTELNIPRGATEVFSNSIGYTFAECTSLKKITINYANIKPFAHSSSGHMFEGCSSLTSVVFKGLGSDVCYMDYVGPYFFAGCTSLQSITLADDVAIFDHAFDGCKNLMMVTVGNSSNTEAPKIIMLGDYAFRDNVTNYGFLMPDNAAYIGTNVFDGWTESQAIKLNLSVADVEQMMKTGVFKGCKAVIYDKDFVTIEIDPETGMPKMP